MIRTLFLLLLLSTAGAQGGVQDTYEFNYSAQFEVGDSSEPLHIFIPLAVENTQQSVLEENIEASIPGTIEQEDVYGNRYWHGYLPTTESGTVSFSMQATVKRKSESAKVPDNEATPEDLEKYLSSNRLVLVDAPILEPIRKEIHAQVNSDDNLALARGIYDWVVDNVEYKKVGTGWGNGDTYWACTERYGNCTDFHALFISLARSEGIPARFEIGFPIPSHSDRVAGKIGGYHCWVQIYLPETGWFPIDASEAFKHPELRDYYFGAHPVNRIHFSTGRDIQLSKDQQSRPLNYFIYPHIEAGGVPYTGKVDTEFSFRWLTDAPSTNKDETSIVVNETSYQD